MVFLSEKDRDSAFIWANASDTYVDVFQTELKRYLHFMSETGTIEFFIMSD